MCRLCTPLVSVFVAVHPPTVHCPKPSGSDVLISSPAVPSSGRTSPVPSVPSHGAFSRWPCAELSPGYQCLCCMGGPKLDTSKGLTAVECRGIIAFLHLLAALLLLQPRMVFSTFAAMAHCGLTLSLLSQVSFSRTAPQSVSPQGTLSSHVQGFAFVLDGFVWFLHTCSSSPSWFL